MYFPSLLLLSFIEVKCIVGNLEMANETGDFVGHRWLQFCFVCVFSCCLEDAGESLLDVCSAAAPLDRRVSAPAPRCAKTHQNGKEEKVLGPKPRLEVRQHQGRLCATPPLMGFSRGCWDKRGAARRPGLLLRSARASL